MAPNGTGTTRQLMTEKSVTPNIKTSSTVNGSTTSARDTVDRTPLNLKSEADRRKTFETWPINFLSPHRLAAAGFYYLRRDDVVRCVFCGVEIGCWEEGDDPFRDHQRWSPNCAYIRRAPVGNIPLDPNNPAIVPLSDSQQNYDTCGRYGIEIRPNAVPEGGEGKLDDQTASLEKLGIHKSRGPAFPKYSTMEARLRSYENWPLSIKQRPDKLSEAGFYYTGKGDQTVCFHCGGGLKDWEESDEPWVEHALWFSRCTYLILIKGKEFVDKVCGEKEALVAAKEAKNIQVPSELKEALQIRNPEAAASRCVMLSLFLEAFKKYSFSSSAAEYVVINHTPKPPELQSSEPLPVRSETSNKVIDDVRLCKICYQEELGVVFLPCGHIVACVKCAPSLNTCAVCRKPFSATVRAFLS